MIDVRDECFLHDQYIEQKKYDLEMDIKHHFKVFNGQNNE